MGVVASPMDPTSSLPSNPPGMISPMDPTSIPPSGPTVTSPTVGGPGSFLTPTGGTTTMALC
jgi:hypothetical protein